MIFAKISISSKIGDLLCFLALGSWIYEEGAKILRNVITSQTTPNFSFKFQENPNEIW